MVTTLGVYLFISRRPNSGYNHNTNAVAQLIEALLYKPEGGGSTSDGIIGIFHWLNPSGRKMALLLTQSLTEMSARDIFWGVKAVGA